MGRRRGGSSGGGRGGGGGGFGGRRGGAYRGENSDEEWIADFVRHTTPQVAEMDDAAVAALVRHADEQRGDGEHTESVGAALDRAVPAGAAASSDSESDSDSSSGSSSDSSGSSSSSGSDSGSESDGEAEEAEAAVEPAALQSAALSSSAPAAGSGGAAGDAGAVAGRAEERAKVAALAAGVDRALPGATQIVRFAEGVNGDELTLIALSKKEQGALFRVGRACKLDVETLAAGGGQRIMRFQRTAQTDVYPGSALQQALAAALRTGSRARSRHVVPNLQPMHLTKPRHSRRRRVASDDDVDEDAAGEARSSASGGPRAHHHHHQHQHQHQHKDKKERQRGHDKTPSQEGRALVANAPVVSGIGEQLLRQMGWTGGKLADSGIEDPVQAFYKPGRRGLGM